jgi:anti-anti-sigma factor
MRFDVGGDILSTNAESLKERLAGDLASAPSPLGTFELNLSQTRMVDSVGLNLLVWLIKQVRARGGKLRISLADANVQRTFQFTRLDREAEVVRIVGEC